MQVTKKLFIETHGCQMNVYDSDKMKAVMLDKHKMGITDNPKEADLILLNTCSIRDKAESRVYDQLGRWKRLKNNNPDLIIGVAGCVASQEGEKIIKRAPFVDLVFGPQTLHRLPDMYEKALKERKPVIDISFPEIEKFDHLPKPQADGPTAFVSIMEGCSKYCSYCIVPYTRGEEVSRPFDPVIAEVMQLAEQGVKEINLLGQNVNDYRGLMHDTSMADLALLIHYIASIDGIERIRFTTSHPTAFSDNLVQAYADEFKLANHLHLPVQHGSDRILSAMKRGYTALEYKSRIRALRKVRPSIAISSDFIVGFPGETEDDFDQLMALVEAIRFDLSFSFIYSRRPGTPAANLQDDTTEEVKKKRLNILQTRLAQFAREYAEAMIGTTQMTLVTGTSKRDDNQLAARTENNRVINLDGHKDLIGTMQPVLITEALTNSLRGKFV